MLQRVVGNLVHFDGGGIITRIVVRTERNGETILSARAIVYVSPSLRKKRETSQKKRQPGNKKKIQDCRVRQNWRDEEFAALVRAATTLCLNHAK